MDTLHANPVGIIKKDIYIIKNDINTKVYIGQALDANERFRSHCKKNSDGSLIDRAIQKYGKEHFWVEIIEHQIENYNEREKYWIKYYGCKTPFGYNILDGGEEPPVFHGDEHPSTRISDAQVKLLKDDLINTTISLSELAKKYDTSKRQVSRINQGLSRSALGEQYPLRKNPNINGKLTEEDVDNIIELLKYTYRFNGDIAKEFGVEVHAIDRINDGTAHHRENVRYPIRAWKSSGVILFTYEQVSEIIELLLNTKMSINAIAKKYNVSFTSIANINRGTAKKYRRDGLSYPLRKF